MNKKLLSYIFIIVSLSSCVSRKETVLFQPTPNEWEYPKDTVVNSFAHPNYEYKLKPGDILSISIGSITPEEFDFVKQYQMQLGQIFYLANDGNQNQTSISTSSSQLINEQFKKYSGFEVDEDGNVWIPKIDTVHLEGLTIKQAENNIQKLLLGFFETPKVRIQLINFEFYVLGEVGHEGKFKTYKPKATILDAIIGAGFFTEFSDRANVKVIRKQGSETKVFYLDFLNENILQQEEYYLYPEDIIVIAPLKGQFWRKYVIPDLSRIISITSASISVVVLILTLNNNK